MTSQRRIPACLLIATTTAAALAASGCTSPLFDGFGQNAARRDSASARGKDAESDMAQNAKPAPPARINTQTHLAAGRMLEKQGDVRAAIAQYEQAIAAEPRSPAGYSRLGILLQKQGRLDDAERVLRQGIRVAPSSALLLNNLGYCYLLQRKFDEARKQFLDALEIAPDASRARMNLAITLGCMGDRKASVAQFSRVVPPEVAHCNLALLETHLGRYDDAARSLREALAINPNCPGAREQLGRVEALAAARDAVNTTTFDLPAVLAGSPDSEAADNP